MGWSRVRHSWRDRDRPEPRGTLAGHGLRSRRCIRHGRRALLPRGASHSPGRGRWFLDGRTAVTAGEFRRFVRSTGYMTVAERPLDPAPVPRGRPGAPRSRLARLPQDGGPGEPGRFPQLVGIRSGRALEACRAGPGRRSTGATAIPSSRSPTRTPRPTRPGRASSCRAKRSGSSPLGAASNERSSPGATSTSRTAVRWRTPGRGSSPGRT